MKKIILLAVIGFMVVFACKTTGTTQPGDNSSATTSEASVKEMETYLKNAYEKMDQMEISEGLNQFIAVLATKSKQKNPSSRVLELARTAETELTKIASGLRLSPGPDWLDENNNQISGNTLGIGKDKTLNPEVLLTYNIGGIIVVKNIPVEFTFVKGDGLLDRTVTTNEDGLALSTIAKVQNVKQEIVIQAALVFTVKGYTYRFENVTCSFLYMPPLKRAAIIVYESAPDFVSDHPFVFDPTYNTLKDIDFDFTQYNGVLMGKEFLKIFGGDVNSIKKLALEQDVPYLIVVYNDCYRLNKAHPDFEIYISEVKATLRILRVADGKTLFEVQGNADKAHNTHGQGSSMEKARNDGFRKAAADLERELKKNMGKVSEALLGR
jgi:hypothetical protein